MKQTKISTLSAQTAHWLQKNAQMFIKSRHDDDVVISTWGKKLISQLANFLKLRNVCSVICLLSGLWFQFSALLEQHVDWGKQVSDMTVFWCLALIQERERALSRGESWLQPACSNPSFADSACVIGFILPQNRGTKAEPAVVLRWQICRLKKTNSIIVLYLSLNQVQPIAFCWATPRACWSQWKFCHQLPWGAQFCLLFKLPISSCEHMGANAKVLNWRSQ